MNHIVIIGFMGSGKTRVGKRLAKDLGLPFIDVDRLIVKKMNMSVKDFIDTNEFTKEELMDIIHLSSRNCPQTANGR